MPPPQIYSFPCSNILLNVLFASNLLQIRIYSFSIWSSAFGLFSHKHILNNLQIIAISLLFTCYKDKSFNWYRHRDIISRKCQFLELYLAGNLLVLLHWAVFVSFVKQIKNNMLERNPM